ncbi:hypothetical protein E4T41_08048 [Aureobasidium subglaciale]|nr:hypothetical protein E4T41_08048 [Aureobasidium subglaciale]
MVNSHNPGLLMWLLLIVPLKEPCWPHCSKICYHVMGLRSGLRVCLLAYLSLSVLPSSYRFRASPQTGLSWLLIGAGIHTILHVAMITEACRLPELSDPGTYHDLLLEYFVSDFFFLLSVRELFKIFHLVPGPCLAKFTFFWKGRHLARGSYERALLRAHQAHGIVVRVAPYAYSVARPSLTLELQHKLHLIYPSKPHLALPHVFKDAYMRYGMSEQLMSQAANNELVIDASVDGLLDSLANCGRRVSHPSRDKYHGENIAWTNSDSMQSSIYLARLAASRLNPAVGDNCDGWNPDKWLNGTDMPCKSYVSLL